jgi:preprotein translocase subunit SecD
MAIFFLLFVNNFLDLDILAEKKIKYGVDFSEANEFLLRPNYNLFIKNKLEADIIKINEVFQQKNIKALAKISNGKLEVIHKKSENMKKMVRLLKRIDGNLAVEKTVENRLGAAYTNKQLSKLNKQLQKKVIDTIIKRLNGEKIRDFKVFAQNKDIVMTVRDTGNIDRIKKFILAPGRLTFHFLAEESESNDTFEVEDNITGAKVSLDREVMLDGESLVKASVSDYNETPVIFFKLNDLGAEKFAKLTRENFGKILAVTIDDNLITTPKINGEISNGEGIINGAFSRQEALRISSLLGSGSLPTKIDILKNDKTEPIIDRNMANAVVLLAIDVIFAIILTLMLFYGRIVIYGGVIILSQVITVVGLTILTNTIVSKVSLLGLLPAFCLAVGFTKLLGVNYKKCFEVAEIKKIKGIMREAFVISETVIDKINVLCGLLFLLFYNGGNKTFEEISLMFLVGVLSNVLIFKCCLKCFLKKKL